MPSIFFLLFLSCLSSGIYAQADFLPPDNEDLVAINSDLTRLEETARSCAELQCPHYQCYEARKIAGMTSRALKLFRLYSFWLRSVGDFNTSKLVQDRYQLSLLIYRRLRLLLKDGTGPGLAEGALARCLKPLSSICEIRFDTSNEFSIYDGIPDYFSAVTFSSDDPASGTAEFPERIVDALRFFDPLIQGYRKDRFYVPRAQNHLPNLSINKNVLRSSEELTVYHSIPRCRPPHIAIGMFDKGLVERKGFERTLSKAYVEPEPKEYSSRATRMTVPSKGGDYEVVAYDLLSGVVLSKVSFRVEDFFPKNYLIGVWRAADGFEIIINDGEGGIRGNIRELGKINQLGKARDLEKNALFWRNLKVEEIEGDGVEIYSGECFEPRKPTDWEPFGYWRKFEITMDTIDSFILTHSACRVSPDQEQGFIRLWRVRPKPKTDLTNSEGAGDEVIDN